MTDPGPDGYGPPPSQEVTDRTAPFFDDDAPPQHDPKVADKIEEGIKKRPIPWAKYRRQ